MTDGLCIGNYHLFIAAGISSFEDLKDLPIEETREFSLTFGERKSVKALILSLQKDAGINAKSPVLSIAYWSCP